MEKHTRRYPDGYKAESNAVLKAWRDRLEKHPAADAFAHLAALCHELGVSAPTITFATKEDHARVLHVLRGEAGGDPAHFDALHVIGMPPSFYGISFDYPGQFVRKARG